MRIEPDQRGDYVLDATALAEKLSIPSRDLRCRLRVAAWRQGRGMIRACVGSRCAVARRFGARSLMLIAGSSKRSGVESPA